MKIVIAGATGWVGTELVRQALRDSRFTSVVALARRAVSIPPDLGRDVEPAKLKSVVIEDYGTYSDTVKNELAGVDGCIWTVAITPSKSKAFDFDVVRKVCLEDAVTGFKTLIEAQREKTTGQPLRFIYMSGIAAERDQTKSPFFMAEYSKMRGQAEVDILTIASEHGDKVEAGIAKPGLILRDTNPLVWLSRSFGLKIPSPPSPVPYGSVVEISAAMLEQLASGFEKETLMHEDLVRIGRAAIQQQ